MRIDSNAQEFLWKQYCIWIELYKFYLDLAFKVNTFFYAITGGIFTYYFSNIGKQYIKYALLLPAIMSATFLGISLYGIYEFRVIKKEVMLLVKEMQLRDYVDFKIIIIILSLFAIIYCFLLFLITGLVMGFVRI
ncbi:hypothetical protein NIES2101_41520 [Calothrix sp. HK-06]|nr:hypothetical protein NIES2101_41520 [Calothrix sp. HK-06]